VMIAITPFITPIAVKIGSRQAIGIGFALAAVGFGWLAFVGSDWEYVAFILPLVAISAGLGLSNGPASSASTSAVPDNQVGQASGISNMARYVGGALFVAAAATVSTTAIDNQTADGASAADALAAGLARSSLLMALICAAGVGFAFLMGRHRGEPPKAIHRAAAAAVTAMNGGNVQAAARDSFRATLVADAIANVVRNVWSNAIIFCGHFPDQTFMFTEDEVRDESRGAWYVRQLIGAANIDGSPLFHIVSGNLSFQVEHHLFPDMPSSRYQEIAPRVREICERYGLPYNTGGFFKQWGTVQRTILRLAFPGGGPRPKPGPYVAPEPERLEREERAQQVPAFP